QKPALIALQDQAGQPPGGIGASIDIDAIGPDLGLRYRRMPVDNDLAKIPLVVEKLLANPTEVLLALRLKRNARTDTGMHEEVTPATKPGNQLIEEGAVRRWRGLEKGGRQIRKLRRRDLMRHLDPIGHQGIEPAQLLPMPEDLGRLEKLRKHRLVVA